MIAVLQRWRRFQVPVAGRAAHLVERNAIMYRRGWFVIVSGFIEPLLYLLAIGFGVGALVGSTVTVNGHPLRYAVFVAPALMASSTKPPSISSTNSNTSSSMMRCWQRRLASLTSHSGKSPGR